MTSATVETFVIGDVDGAQTGDAGEVIWTAYTTNDKTQPSASAQLTLNARDFLTFRFITFLGGTNSGAGCVTAAAHSSDITFYKCAFIASHTQGTAIFLSATVDLALNWLIDGCIFYSGGALFSNALPTSTIADYDLNFQWKNCLFLGAGSNSINISASGANSFKPGGMDVFNCSFFGKNGAFVTGANMSTSIPCTVYNSFVHSTSACLSANTTGQIVEDYNVLWSATTRTNVTAGTHTIAATSGVAHAPMIDIGQWSWLGKTPRMLFSHLSSSPYLGFGAQSGGPSTDILGLTRSAGSILKGDNGIVSSATNLTLTDASKLFPSGGFKGYSVRILTGIGSGQVKTINDNDTGTLRVDGFWNPTPTIDSTYLIYAGATATMGQTTSGGALSNTRIEDANAKWGTNQWLGYTIGFASGAGASGEFISSVVSGSTATIITATGSFARNPASGDSYRLYKGSGVFFVNPSVGCYEHGNTAIKETGTVRTAGTGIRIQGPGTQDFDIPVDFSATTVSVYGRYDTEYSGVLPQLIIRNGEECGVSPKSGTMTAGANTWEQLSLVVNPSGKGVITARLQSNSVTPAGATFWDDFATI